MDLGLAGRACVVACAGGPPPEPGGAGLGAEIARRLRAEEATVLGVDLGDPDAGERIAAAASRFGALDVLVNVGPRPASPDATAGEDWGSRFELDVLAPLRTMRAAVPAMAARGRGRVVNVAAACGRRPSAADPAGSVAGAAQLALSRLFADRYARSGVLVNAVCAAPGADPAATAPTVVLLCSERASYVSGAAWDAGGSALAVPNPGGDR